MISPTQALVCTIHAIKSAYLGFRSGWWCGVKCVEQGKIGWDRSDSESLIILSLLFICSRPAGRIYVRVGLMRPISLSLWWSHRGSSAAPGGKYADGELYCYLWELSASLFVFHPLSVWWRWSFLKIDRGCTWLTYDDKEIRRNPFFQVPSPRLKNENKDVSVHKQILKSLCAFIFYRILFTLQTNERKNLTD